MLHSILGKAAEPESFFNVKLFFFRRALDL